MNFKTSRLTGWRSLYNNIYLYVYLESVSARGEGLVVVEGLERALVAVGAVHAQRRQQLEHLLLHRRVRRVQS